VSRFGYSAILDSGRRITGTLRCGSRYEALTQLCSKGYHPLELEPLREGGMLHGGLTRRLRDRVSMSQLAVVTRQLSSLLRAGLPVVEALATLRGQAENRRLVRVIEDVQETLLHEGGTLADALACRPDVFGPVYRSLVRSGEKGGGLGEVLRDLGRHLTRTARLRGQVTGALIYPLFLLLLGATAIFVLMAFVIPSFEELFESFGRDLPRPTRLLIAFSGFVSSWWWAVLAGLGLVLLSAWALMRRAAVRLRVDRLLLRLPVIGPMLLKLAISRIARTLGALAAGGVPILAALRITGETVRNRAIRATFGPMVASVSAGDTLAAAASKAGLYPPLMVNLIRTGEDTGELAEMLNELAAIYEEEAERAVSGAVKLLEPVLIIVMGAVIAGIVGAVMLPVFEANVMVE